MRALFVYNKVVILLKISNSSFKRCLIFTNMIKIEGKNSWWTANISILNRAATTGITLYVTVTVEQDSQTTKKGKTDTN